MYSPNRSGGLVTVRWRYRLPVSATAANASVKQDQYESAGIDGAADLAHHPAGRCGRRMRPPTMN